jgi:hypothetical protein
MASISETQKTQMISLLQSGELDSQEIAARFGVSPQTIRAIKAHITMGTFLLQVLLRLKPKR